jgi:hypothetical protein
MVIPAYECKVRAKDNDCKYGPWKLLSLTCGGALE